MNTEAKLQELLDLGQTRGFYTEARNNEVTVYLVTPAEFRELKSRPVYIRACFSTKMPGRVNYYEVGVRTRKVTSTEALNTIRNTNI